jgi:hypothetical protein
MISFGALVSFSAINLSVIKYRVIDGGRRSGRALILFGVLPACGPALTAWPWTSLQVQSMVVGLSWLGSGAAYLLVITRELRTTPPAMELGDCARMEISERSKEPVDPAVTSARV